MINLALFISGGGTTATAILKECLPNGRLFGKINPVMVISSDPAAKGIDWVIATGAISKENVVVVNPKDYGSSQDDFGSALLQECHSRNVNLIGQYGWMPMTPKVVIQAFPNRMINQHPGPLDIGRPDFGGKSMYGSRVHFVRLYFVRKTRRDYWTEATAQRVHEKWDLGKIIKRREVNILPSDDTTALQERVLPVEHEVQISALLDFADDTVEEWVREEPLVRPGEEIILEEAKVIARLMYPRQG